MLAFNTQGPTPYEDLPKGTTSKEFFAKVASQSRGPSILLLAGSDFASWTVRQQQAVVRYDRRPSDYSHAVLVLEWNAEHPELSYGFEIDPVRVAAQDQKPEVGGVTSFRVRDFMNAKSYPNLAVIDVPLAGELRERAVVAAREPMRDVLRYPLFRWLAVWRAFVSVPESVPHPLWNRTPHPGAAYVAMVYEAAEITLVPGATDMQHCPEVLWANAKYWRDAVSENVRITRLVRDPEARSLSAEPTPIPLP
jgi:hypothetical protein